jgi:hypothetical protein
MTLFKLSFLRGSFPVKVPAVRQVRPIVIASAAEQPADAQEDVFIHNFSFSMGLNDSKMVLSSLHF